MFRFLGVAISILFWVIAYQGISKWSQLDGFTSDDKWVAWSMLIMVILGDIVRHVDSYLQDRDMEITE